MEQAKLTPAELINRCAEIFRDLEGLDLPDLVEAVNGIRAALSAHSPFRDEPVDLVEWVGAETVQANTYNPNRVAPPEMKLLELSITRDGFTQPIVVHPGDTHLAVVDGFHRSRVGKESREVKERLRGYLPVTRIRATQGSEDDRMASTIRHNRARGKHQVDAMTDIVLELSRRNWTDQKIAKELGMEKDEVLRFKQIGGLAALFADAEFSEAWDIAER